MINHLIGFGDKNTDYRHTYPLFDRIQADVMV